jgi:hypothetical protein
LNSTLENIQAVRDILTRDGQDPEEFFPSCVGCSYCCRQATCLLGVKLFGAQYPCPALFWNGGKYRCKLAENFKEDLYIGCGCSSSLNSWRKEVRER